MCVCVCVAVPAGGSSGAGAGAGWLAARGGAGTTLPGAPLGSLQRAGRLMPAAPSCCRRAAAEDEEEDDWVLPEGVQPFLEQAPLYTGEGAAVVGGALHCC